MQEIEIVSGREVEHLVQLPQLLEAATRADGHEPLGEHKFLRVQQCGDQAEASLAVCGGALAGYAHTVTYGRGGERRSSCEFVVHPEYRRLGVGARLLADAMQQARFQRARRIDLWSYNDASGSGELAARYGFAPRRRLLHLHRHLGDVPQMPMMPGSRLRPFRPGIDEAALLGLNNRIFADHPEQGAWSAEDLAARMAQPWFDAEDLQLLEVDGELAGFCWLKVEERGDDGRVGEIYVIGTLPEYQSRGLGRMLVASALARLRDRDVGTAAIYVDESNVAAVRLYKSSGFHYHHVDVCYSRELRASESTPVSDDVAAA